MKLKILTITFGLIALGLAAFIGVDQWRSDGEEPFAQAHPTAFWQFLEGTPENSASASSPPSDTPMLSASEVQALVSDYIRAHARAPESGLPSAEGRAALVIKECGTPEYRGGNVWEVSCQICKFKVHERIRVVETEGLCPIF